MEENLYYTYIYLDPRKPGKFKYWTYEFDFEPIYIGFGHKERCYSHLKKARNKNYKRGRAPLLDKLNKMLNEGHTPIIIKLMENITPEEAKDYEIFLIHLIGRKDLKKGSLLNLTNGGDGTPNPSWATRNRISKSNKGKTISDEIKKKASERTKGNLNPMYGKKHSEETLEKMREKRAKQIFTVETRKKISLKSKGNKYNLGRKQSEEEKQKRAKANMGKKRTKETKIKQSLARIQTSNLVYSGKNNGRSKKIDTIYVLQLRSEGKTIKELCTIFNVSESVIIKRIKNPEKFL